MVSPYSTTCHTAKRQRASDYLGIVRTFKGELAQCLVSSTGRSNSSSPALRHRRRIQSTSKTEEACSSNGENKVEPYGPIYGRFTENCLASNDGECRDAGPPPPKSNASHIQARREGYDFTCRRQKATNRQCFGSVFVRRAAWAATQREFAPLRSR
jgi:hypothetical protein